MSWYCVHERIYPGTLYEPPEPWCDIDDDDYCCGDDCPHRYSREDYEADRADYEYDMYRDSIDF